MKTNRSTLAAMAIVGALFLSLSSVAKADDYKLDPVHSFALFRVHHFGAGYVWGTFAGPSGTVSYDPADVTKATFEATIKVDTIDTRNENRNKDLKGPDFFDVKQYPDATFKSKSVKKTGDNKMDVTGDFTIHGVTKEITIPMEMTGLASGVQGGTRIGFETTFTIDRRDYKVSGDPDPMVGNDIRITVALEGIKQ